MQLTITSVDYAPEELHDQVPIVVELLREIPGDDRPDYWLASVQPPIRWLNGNHFRDVSHVVLAARWHGTRIGSGVTKLPVGIGYVVDPSLLSDDHLDLAKCAYVAIGLASDTTAGKAPPISDKTQTGYIARAFWTGWPMK